MNFSQLLNPLRGTSFAWLFPLTWRVIKWIAPGVPITIEVFLHHRFGNRSGLVLLKGFILLAVLSAAVAVSYPPGAAPLFQGFVVAYSFAAIAHWLRAQYRPQNEQIHSYSTGEPWFTWRDLPFAPAVIEHYLEPTFCFLLACMLQTFDLPVARWLMIAASSLFIKGQVIRVRLRTRQLDTLDNRIEIDRIDPRTRRENEPFVQARPAPPRPNRRRTPPRPQMRQ